MPIFFVFEGFLRSLVVSQELATINVNSPVLCNEAESHETLGEKHVVQIEHLFLTLQQHIASTCAKFTHIK